MRPCVHPAGAAPRGGERVPGGGERLQAAAARLQWPAAAGLWARITGWSSWRCGRLYVREIEKEEEYCAGMNGWTDVGDDMWDRLSEWSERFIVGAIWSVR